MNVHGRHFDCNAFTQNDKAVEHPPDPKKLGAQRRNYFNFL